MEFIPELKSTLSPLDQNLHPQAIHYLQAHPHFPLACPHLPHSLLNATINQTFFFSARFLACYLCWAIACGYFHETVSMAKSHMP